jgi:hypothetical protein
MLVTHNSAKFPEYIKRLGLLPSTSEVRNTYQRNFTKYFKRLETLPNSQIQALAPQ